MKRLYACGDSFMVTSTSAPGTHVSELVANALSYDLVSFAYLGGSNGVICVQIETAIKEKADFILVNTTSADRIELPLDSSEGCTKFSVYDFLYPACSAPSPSDTGHHGKKRLRATNLSTEFVSVALHEREQIRNYFENFFHYQWKYQIDHWCLYSVFHQLHLSGIPYLLIIDQANIVRSCPWITDKNTTLPFNVVLTDVRPVPFFDHGYHTTTEFQVMLADTILKHIEKYQLL